MIYITNCKKIGKWVDNLEQTALNWLQILEIRQNDSGAPKTMQLFFHGQHG